MTEKRKLAEVYLSCGRHYLNVAGIALAMEGDKCRAQLPEDVLDPIPAEELEHATIGGKPIRDMPMDVIRFFRGDNWTPKMLQYVADQINTQNASPDLLAACKAVVEQDGFVGSGLMRKRIAEMKAAIEKAEGHSAP